MTPMFSLFAVAAILGASTVSATNFWLAEVLTGVGCTGQFCGSSTDLLFVTQSSTTPGCVEADSARDAGAYPPSSFFQSVACGVTINFYKSGSDYIYYQNNGNGQALGSCVPNNGPSHFCLELFGSSAVNGRYSCTNYQQVVNGINPCQY
ncbi:hypothetical protein GQ53DRAFT_757192 [Thozetella sp. PMI_491]|nr:hypothetical protein GQ53DRAFT_757192 [Thozetella sp. PMI_491]